MMGMSGMVGMSGMLAITRVATSGPIILVLYISPSNNKTAQTSFLISIKVWTIVVVVIVVEVVVVGLAALHTSAGHTLSSKYRNYISLPIFVGH